MVQNMLFALVRVTLCCVLVINKHRNLSELIQQRLLSCSYGLRQAVCPPPFWILTSCSTWSQRVQWEGKTRDAGGTEVPNCLHTGLERCQETCKSTISKWFLALVMI
jgi:hypothetical protein